MNVNDSSFSAEQTAGYTLSMDTAGPACQVVVAAGDSVLAMDSQAMRRGHGEALIPMVEAVLAKAGLSYEDLDRLAVCVGPGSFTGIRVGVAAARALSATLNIPVVGIGTLEALAVSDALQSDVKVQRAVALDARNGLVYGQRFSENGDALDDPSVVADLVFAASLKNETRLVGPAQAVLSALMRSASKRATLGLVTATPLPEALAYLAQRGNIHEKPIPLYLKSADAVPAKPAGLRSHAL